MRLDFNNVPKSLLKKRQWVYHDAKKIPYSAITGEPFHQREEELATLEEVNPYLDDEHGLGIYLTAGLVGVDLDNAIDEDGIFKDWVEELLDKLPNTYVERSPSGQGLHVLFFADTSVVKKHNPHNRFSGERAQAVFDLSRPLINDTKANGGEEIELYWKNRYFTFTGEVESTNTPLAVATGWLENALTKNEEYNKLNGVTNTPQVATTTKHNHNTQRGKDYLNLIEKDKELNDLYHNPAADDEDKSQQDFRLALLLFELVGDDDDKVEELMANSGRIREKWWRNDYIPRTIGNAKKEWEKKEKRRPIVSIVGEEKRKYNRIEARQRLLPAWRAELPVIDPYIPAGDIGRPVTRYCYQKNPKGYHEKVGNNYLKDMFSDWLSEDLNMDYSKTNLDGLIDYYLHAGVINREYDATYIANNPAYKATDGSHGVVWYRNCGYDYAADKVVYPKEGDIIPAWVDHELNLNKLNDNDYYSNNRLQQAFDEWELPEQEQELLLQAGAASWCATNHGDKMIILVGTAGAGKSVYTALMRYIARNLGITSTLIRDIAKGEFHLAKLPQSFINIDSDSSNNYIPSTDILKTLVSAPHSELEVQRKFRGSVTTAIPTTLMLALNELPRVGDLSEGWLDRLLIFKFTKKFRGTGDEDPNLLDKMKADTDKIILQHHHALRRFYQNNRVFKREGRMLEELANYEQENNPVKAWVEETVIEDDEGFLTTEEAQNAFNKWMEKQAQKQWGRRKFGHALSQVLGNTTRKRVGGAKKRGIEGYALTPALQSTLVGG